MTIEKVYKGIGLRIAAARKERRLTQQDLCGCVSLTRVSIANIEGGKQRIMLHCLLEIASILRVDPAFLLTGKKYDN